MHLSISDSGSIFLNLNIIEEESRKEMDQGPGWVKERKDNDNIAKTKEIRYDILEIFVRIDI